MGQIVRRKKKGRPSKADLARRSGDSPATAQSDLRRSRRRRNVRYNIDYDDYLDEEDEDEEEDERRREKKKLKLVVKLNNNEEEDEDEEDSAPSRRGSRGSHAREEEKAKEGEDDEDEEEGEEEEEEGNEDAEEHEEVKARKVDSKGLHSVSGTPSKLPPGIPLPDKRTLELILDKLQKKDTYGVYAEPVDPEELPDYHDVIEHPMDFSTVRKKLANGSYHTLEQFESDVFLICSNAMQYNAAETIYHKQARSIQELARKKFEKLRIDFERSQSELKSEQKTRSNPLVKKLAKKPLGHTSQEPVGSDFSSGATLATIGDVLPTSHPMQGVICERPGNIDGLTEGNAFLMDANQEKAEDYLSGKGMLSKLGRKSSVQDIERRATYNMSNLPITRSDSIFSTFESEIKQLVTVGLQAEYSYARSLARFAATLGPTAWKIASRRIQQALPPGCKFGRGWVGEYEPLPTPVLMLDNRVQKQQPNMVTKLQPTTESIKVDKNLKNMESTMEPVNGPIFEGKQPSVSPCSGITSEGRSSFFGSAGPRPNAHINLFYQQSNAQTRNLSKSENKGLKQVELNSPPSGDQNNASLVAKLTSNTPAAVSKPREMAPNNMNILPSIPFKQPDANGVVSGELPNGKVRNASLNRRMTGPSSENTSNQTGRAAPFVAHGQEQNLNDPVQLMRMLAEKAQKQQTTSSSNHSPADTPPVTPSGRREDSSNASAAAARAWMSVGAAGFKQGPDNSSSPKNQISADSLYNPAREFHQHISRVRGEFSSGGMPFQSEKNNFPFQALVPQPIHPVGVSQFPNRPMVFSQVAASDLSRFQMLPWRGIRPQSQPRQKQETLPPDLNIGFQSPGSPAKQSSGVLVDSQQPDLALQL
ncbi:uncharacterized protein LOC113874897 [Abrus precatorius]|uniref:Uncharacterized protein LOC113874897 n=1 Tax=Abrus precatorius TaxID=3816 RepID=A0A8B8MK50_ABRPR|nr:uncharacterized protein LOC113874897 [Abrus precatorius]